MFNEVLRSLISNSDSYKAGHFAAYPPEMKYVTSYIEARGGSDRVMFFGLQMILSKLKAPTREEVAFAKHMITSHGLPFNEDGWNYIADLGYLPIRIQAVPEGSYLPVRTALVQITNTDPNVPWLTSYIETMLLRVWYPCSVATVSKKIKDKIWQYLQETSDTPEAFIDFRLHDFGARGATCEEAAEIGGLAHLVNFKGTDTLGALWAAREIYNEPMAGYSVPATEHSISTAWGKDREELYLSNLIDVYGKPGAIFSSVSDTYDLYHCVDEIYGKKLKEKIINSDATLVVRPDSGDPLEIVTWTIESLGKNFGYTTNKKGFKVLHKSVRIIQGDGVDLHAICQILEKFKNLGWSAENIVFGMGGALLQKVNRDSYKFAQKACAYSVDGKIWVPIHKNPVTDPGKASKKGRLAVVKSCGIGGCSYSTINEHQLMHGQHNLLEDVWVDGKIVRWQTLEEIRKVSNETY